MKMFELKAETRKLIYGVIAAIVPLLVALGTVSSEAGQTILGVSAAVLTIGGSALALNNIKEDK